MSRHSRKIYLVDKKLGHVKETNEAYLQVMKQNQKVNIDKENELIDEQNSIIVRTATMLLPIINYANEKLEYMIENLESNNRFSMKFRNLANHAIKECEKFVNVMEAEIPDKMHHERYTRMFESFGMALDRWYDDLCLGTCEEEQVQQPTLDLKRRAKLRYRDPYKTCVKECNDAFEDGYTKGWQDAINELMHRLQGKQGEKMELNFDEHGGIIINDQ